MRLRCELSKQLQADFDVVTLSRTHLTPQNMFFITNDHIYRTERFPAMKAEVPLQLEKAFTISIYLPPHFQ
jgi:hypothetical protein